MGYGYDDGLQISAMFSSHGEFVRAYAQGASKIALRQNRMAHASEILHQISDSGLRYVEAPVTVEYSAYSLAKGQTLQDALMILTDLFARRLHR